MIPHTFDIDQGAGAVRHRLTIACCLIVRDAEGTIEATLASVAPWVDELIVVDTGSVDETVAICQGWTDRIYHFDWVDSFASARQYAYDQATADWIMHLDADDVLNDGDQIRLSVAAADPPVGGLAWRYITQRDPSGRAVSEIWRERITRRGAYHWEGRVHEVLIPDGPWVTVPDESVSVEHLGYADPQASARRNVRLGELQLAEQMVPRRRTLWYLGRDCCVLQEWQRAAFYLEAYRWEARDDDAAASDPTDLQEHYMGLLMLAHCRRQLGQHWQAMQHDGVASALAPLIPHAYFGLAQSAHALGRHQEVIYWCEIGRRLHMPPTSVIPGASLELQAGWMILYAEALAQSGQLGRAAAVSRAALELRPDDPAHLGLLAQIEQAQSAQAAAAGGQAAGLQRVELVHSDGSE
jgi:hypothetical protein